MAKRYKEFIQLPVRYYNAPEFNRALRISDKLWLRKKLALFPKILRGVVTHRYSRIFIETYHGEPICFKKMANARRAANLYLLDRARPFEL